MKRLVVVLLLCVTVAACSSSSSGGGTPPPAATPTSQTVADIATTLATADGHPPQWSRYITPLRTLVRRCAGSTAAVAEGVEVAATLISRAHIPSSALEVVTALAALPKSSFSVGCVQLANAYTAEVTGTGPAAAKSGWGGYGGSVTAWNAVHRADHARPGSYLPRRHGLDAYQLLESGQVTSMYERFDPPISAKFALAQIVHDLLPGKVHPAYTLVASECQQAIYLGSQLGGLLHSSALGAFVELTSGKGVGHTHYNRMQVDRARITPLGAIGGQPCT